MRKLNLSAVVWTLLMLGIVVGIGTLFFTGNMGYFLHPRTWGALGAAAVTLALLTLVSVRSWRSGHSRAISFSHLLFLLPLLCGLLVSPEMLSKQMIAQKGLSGIFHHGHDHSHGGGRHVILQPAGRIVVTDDQFLSMMEEFWERADALSGREVEIAGFVYSAPSLGKHNFVLARLVMTCCAADAEIAGMICRWPDRADLQDGDWVRIVGTLAKQQFYNLNQQEPQMMPYLEVKTLEKIEKPEQEYIYP